MNTTYYRERVRGLAGDDVVHGISSRLRTLAVTCPHSLADLEAVTFSRLAARPDLCAVLPRYGEGVLDQIRGFVEQWIDTAARTNRDLGEVADEHLSRASIREEEVRLP